MKTQSRAELEAVMDALSQYVDNSVEVIDELSERDQRRVRLAQRVLARVEAEHASWLAVDLRETTWSVPCDPAEEYRSPKLEDAGLE